MQNRYVGDIGDFGKYGLLRHMTGMGETSPPGDPLRLGVVWYLFPDELPKEPGKGDGKFIDYLRNPKPRDSKLRDCDSYLYNELLKIVIQEKDRRVLRVQGSGILSPDTLYYDQCLSYEPGESGDTRKLRRAEWLNSALEATKEADLVFVDPDNGIAIPDNGGANQADGITKVDPYSKKGPKYVFMEDLNRFYCNGKSLVIYQHLTRQGKAPEQIARLSEKLQQSLKLPCLPLALWYHRGTARAYFIVAQKQHEQTIWERLQEFQNKPCWFERQPGFKHPHFELVT